MKFYTTELDSSTKALRLQFPSGYTGAEKLSMICFRVMHPQLSEERVERFFGLFIALNVKDALSYHKGAPSCWSRQYDHPISKRWCVLEACFFLSRFQQCHNFVMNVVVHRILKSSLCRCIKKVLTWLGKRINEMMKMASTR